MGSHHVLFLPHANVAALFIVDGACGYRSPVAVEAESLSRRIDWFPSSPPEHLWDPTGRRALVLQWVGATQPAGMEVAKRVLASADTIPADHGLLWHRSGRAEWRLLGVRHGWGGTSGDYPKMRYTAEPYQSNSRIPHIVVPGLAELGDNLTLAADPLALGIVLRHYTFGTVEVADVG